MQLIEEASRKAAVAWLTVPGAGPAYPVWCGWLEGALFVIGGPGEQATPGLSELTDAATSGVRVSLRGDHGGRVVTWPAEVSVVQPGSPQWETTAAQVAAKRLNATVNTAELVERWAAECRLYRLSPAGEATECGQSLPNSDLAAPVRPTPARREVRKPVRIHRVRQR